MHQHVSNEYENILRPGHSSTHTTVNKLGPSVANLGKLEKAEMQEHALQAREGARLGDTYSS